MDIRELKQKIDQGSLSPTEQHDLLLAAMIMQDALDAISHTASYHNALGHVIFDAGVALVKVKAI